MVQVPILNGIYTDGGPDFRTSYPVNMLPVPKQNGISAGYLRPAEGIVTLGTGPGVDRGGIEWNGVCYRVMGSKLVTVDTSGGSSILGDVGTDGDYVTFDYSFSDLCIASNGNLFLYNPTDGLRQNVDPDLGVVVDVVWVDGYFMTTDGEYLVVTDLNNPLAVNPLKYGSSEADPDPVIALHKLRNEVLAVNRHTIEYFDNVGGDLFPFARIEGAQIMKGAVGTHACCEYMDALAFVGSGFNEAPGVYIGANATASKISTREVDAILLGYTEAELSDVKLEARNDRANQLLYIHLPDRTLVFDYAATQALGGEPAWHVLTSGVAGYSHYRGRNFVRFDGEWLCGDTDSAAFGRLDETLSSHWGQKARWEFGTIIVYNEGNGAQFHELELVALPGRVAFGATPYITTSYSVDGETWSMPQTISAGTLGQRGKRLVWMRQGSMKNWRIQRFQGDSDAHVAFARLQVRLEPLAW